MKNFTFLKVGIWAISFTLVTAVVSAQTAVQSGTWSDPNTWENGTAPTFTLGNNASVIIPQNIVVTIDNAIIVNGAGIIGIGAASLEIEGELVSNNNGDLILTAGNISGDGKIVVEDFVLDGGTFSFTGNAQAKNITSSTTVSLAANLLVKEMFTLSSGTFTVANGGNFEVEENTMININSGSLVLSGGTVSLINEYDVKYSQGSSTTGFEVDGPGLRDVTIDVGNANTVTFSSDLDVEGTLTLQTGTLNLNGNDLTVNGSFVSSADARIASSNASDITFNTTSGTTGTLNFTTAGNSVSDLNINIGEGNWLTVGDNLNIHGILKFTSGGINIDDNDLVIESTGSITGAGASSYVITGNEGSLAMYVSSGGTTYKNFPVGTSTSYMPAMIQLNSNTTTTLMEVGVDNGVLSQGNSGTDWASDSSVVNATWFVRPQQVGSNVEANIRFLWNDTNEVNGFDRTRAVVGHYMSGSWMMLGMPSAATNSNGMWMLQANNVQEFSPFAIFQGAPASINENALNLSMDIFPNPSADRININFADDLMGIITMDIVDVQGRVMNNYKLTGNANSIDISHLPSGNYFIRFSDSYEFTAVRKVVKL